jgi:hypothetical protein
MPRTQLGGINGSNGEGDIPLIAVATGSADAVECVLPKIGIATSEFTPPGMGGRVNFYYDSSNGVGSTLANTWTCGGGGTANACGTGSTCTPLTTCPANTCGYISDGCGGRLACSLSICSPYNNQQANCQNAGCVWNSGPRTCTAHGGVSCSGGTPTCINGACTTGTCTAKTTCPSGQNCGYASNGCSSTLVCGSGAVTGCTPPVSVLYGSVPTLEGFNVIIWDCVGNEITKTAQQIANVQTYTNAGGRMFATHYEYVYLFTNSPFGCGNNTFPCSVGPPVQWTTAHWHINQGSPANQNANIDTNFAKGLAFSQWLAAIGSGTTTSPPTIPVQVLRRDFDNPVNCGNLTSSATCTAAPNGCAWKLCSSLTNQNDCTMATSCTWTSGSCSGAGGMCVSSCGTLATLAACEAKYGCIWGYCSSLGNQTDCTQTSPPTGCTWNSGPPATCVDGGSGTGGMCLSTGSQRWLNSVIGSGTTTNPQPNPLEFTFNTPVGVPAAQQCGRVLFSDYHVFDTSWLGTTTMPAFPNECDMSALNAQEQVIEYMLFDLSNCITSDQGCPPNSCSQALGLTGGNKCSVDGGSINCCGPVGDGCGNLAHGGSCGTCTSPQTCGGGGTLSRCGLACTPLTQSAACGTWVCGSVSDGCGGSISCGTCVAPTPTCVNGTCSASGSCTPLTSCPPADTCGLISDGCSSTINCGTCPANYSCESNACVQTCFPKTCTQVIGLSSGSCTADGGSVNCCGQMSDGCAAVLQCGSCTAPDTCSGAGQANVCGHMGG